MASRQRHVLIIAITSTSTFNNMAQGDEMQLDTEPQEVSETLDVKDGQ